MSAPPCETEGVDDDEARIEFPRMSAWTEWVVAEREAYAENVDRLQRSGNTPPSWDAHLQVMSFDYLQRAVTLEAQRRDSTGESIADFNAAVDELKDQLEHFRLSEDDVDV